MDLVSIRVFLFRKEIRMILLGTTIGGILQIIRREYIKRHPEFLKVEPDRKPRLPRGGAFIEITSISIKVISKVVIKFIAKKKLLTGLLATTGIIASKIPVSAISTYLSDALPQNLPELEKKKYVLVNGEKIYLDQCDENLQYLFMVLKNPMIPFEEKKKLTSSILTKYLDLKTVNGRLNFVLCIVFICYAFVSIGDSSNYHILLRNLIKAIKQGKISKVVGRAIIRKLRKKGIPVDPELVEIVNS